MFASKRKNFLKINSGATLFAVVPTLALQAQEGDAISKADQLSEELYKSTGLDVKSTSACRYVFYTVILASSVFLLYCLACFVDRKLALKVLQKKYDSKLLDLENKKVYTATDDTTMENLSNFWERIKQIKDDLDCLNSTVKEMKDKNSAEKAAAEARSVLEYYSSSLGKTIDDFVSSMREAGIYVNFEEKYFKLNSVIDDTNSVERLQKTECELFKEFETECKDAGSCSLRDRDIVSAVGKKAKDYTLCDSREFNSEKKKRLEAEKEKNSGVYKAYLRYNFVKSLLQLLEMKKKVEDAIAQLKKYEGVDCKKNLKVIQNKISEHDLKFLSLLYYGGLGDENRKRIFAEDQTFITKFTGYLEEVEKLKVEDNMEKNIQTLDNLFSDSNKRRLGEALKNTEACLKEKLEERKACLKKSFESKKKEIEDSSFFHVPGKYAREYYDFEF